MKIFRRKAVIILIVVIVFIYIAYGLIGGFLPFEQRLIESRVREYVIATHGLTPTEVRVTTLYLWFPVTARVETKEHNFWFEIRTERFYYSDRYFSDDLLARKAGYILSSDLRAYVEKRTSGEGLVWGTPGTGGDNLRSLITLSEIEANPSIVFERLQRQYTLSISLSDEITAIDYDLVYDIFTWIMEAGLQPRRVVFSFVYPESENWGTMSVGITCSPGHGGDISFADINSRDGLERLFEESIRFRKELAEQIRNNSR